MECYSILDNHDTPFSKSTHFCVIYKQFYDDCLSEKVI